MPRTALHDAKTAEEVPQAVHGRGVDARDEDGRTALMQAAQHGGEHGAGMMRLLVDAGADANKQSKDGWTALMMAAWRGSAEAMRLLVARGAALPLSEALHTDTPPAHAEYIRGAQSWTPLHRAADARDFAALFAQLRERAPLYERHDDAVASPHARMRTALSIAASDSYACAAPVDERCLALVRRGPVWSVESHALCPADERTAASARALMMGAKRVGADGKPHKIDIGPATGSDGVERFVPREIWGMIFRFLIFEDGYHDACPAQRMRIS